MPFITEVRKAVTENTRTPVYAVVGATDLAVEKVRDVRGMAASADLSALPAIAQQSFDGLVTRGEQLVRRLRDQQATKDLVASAGSTVARGKGAVTTAKHAASDTQRAAKATLTTTRRQAAKVAGTVSDVVADDAAAVKASLDQAGAATKTSAKRTATTARRRAARTTAATKAAATSAAKTSDAAAEAASTGADTVGD